MNKPKGIPDTKRKYRIMLRGVCVGESIAVSPEKAINNWWWKNVKGEDEFSPRYYDPSEFDAVEG